MHLDYSQHLAHDEYPRAHLRIELKPTNCPRKTSAHFHHHPECGVQTGARIPEIDCIACHNGFADCMTKQYLAQTMPMRAQACGDYVIGQHGVAMREGN
ncbi:uncharacterized protein si:dkeyp-73d8.9 [Engraulis encrasicolus]|uniref:uncharacterized protein si:dkeyp-73d8.9 n=1 Tax=Engraulis encrasicolus TaxID=184585 RepID=UPI002FD13C01